MSNKNNTYLSSKPRYEILDGLRGVAAMLVVVFHIFETYSAGPLYQVINHGYLAVDFFFVLSGFVIGYAYDDRWNRMSTWNFVKRRLIRLHPMVVFSMVLGLLLFYFGGGKAFPAVDHASAGMVLLVFLWSLTLIPLPPSMDIRGWQETSPLDGTAWTLQWEYLANLIYALVIRHLNKLWLAVCVCLFALLTVNLTMNIDVFHVFTSRSYAAYTVIGGWSLTPDQLVIGATRLLYPFFMGLLISRVGKLFSVRGGFWWCSLVIASILAMPRIGGETHMWMNGLYECLCILCVFPLLPLYISHFPFIYLQMAWKSSHEAAPLTVHVVVGVSVFLLAVLTAWAAYKMYDVPVREWLKKKLYSK